jgi:predicted metal-dependent hydrolase
MNLQVDDLRIELRRSARRKSVQLTVDRGGELVVSAPDDCALSVVEAFVREKRRWIYTKLAEKQALSSSDHRKRYVSGEGFFYLGRSYRLLIVDEQDVPLKLSQGRLKLRRVDAPHARQHLVDWYIAHARPWLERRVARYENRVGRPVSRVVVQDLGYRWGSCSKDQRLNFNFRTILLPPPIIEYVVVHELVHLLEPHHTPAFWMRVERVLPDFAQRKQWLAEHGGELTHL